MPVPLFDTATPLAPLRPRLQQVAAEVLASGQAILGPNVEAFERELAAYLGARHVVGVANGTDALTLALRAMGVGEGDEVVVPSFTFWASAEAIPPTGARPVFCDIDPETFCITADTVRAVLTPRTKAVVAVDLFGNAAPIDEIRALGVPVLEDAAQAAGATLRGARAGALGDAATFSFYPSKNLGAFGDAGAVVTDDDAIADRVRLLHDHGTRDRVTYEAIGFNSRLDELQAALLRVLLPHLDGWVEGRRAAHRHYAEAGVGELVAAPVAVDGCEPAWHLYVVRHERPDELSAALTARGVGNRGYYRTPVHRQPAMAAWARDARLPATEQAARTHLALPISPVLGPAEAAEVAAGLRDAAAVGC